jgi:hypothetical protein
MGLQVSLFLFENKTVLLNATSFLDLSRTSMPRSYYVNLYGIFYRDNLEGIY